jgi:nucleotide-binding universal stress UspA family protein
MPSFKHILFPIDFFEQSRGIAPHVVCMARRYRARVTVLHAMEIPGGAYPGWPVYGPAMDLNGMEEDRRARVESFLRDEFQGVDTVRLMLEGDPAFRIAEYAENEGVDLIMMPTHGYGPFRRFLLGSVTAKVLHDVNCAVWTSAHAPEKAAPPTGYRRVLCALDGTTEDLALLRWATLFACELGGSIKLAHAIPGASLTKGADIEGERFRTFLFDSARERFRALQREAGTSVETVLQGGDVATVVRRVAEQDKSDLVVIGRGVMHEPFGRMRTKVFSIIREAPCPVISI